MPSSRTTRGATASTGRRRTPSTPTRRRDRAWARGGDHLGRVRRPRVRRSGCSATSTGSTSSSSAAARRTSPPGSPGAARGPSASTSRRRSSRRRGAARRRRLEFPLVEASAEDVPAPGRELRPRVLRVRREHLVRPVPLDPGGVPAAPARRAARGSSRNSPLVDPVRARGPEAHVRDAPAPAARPHRLEWPDERRRVPAAARRLLPSAPANRLRGRRPRRALSRPTSATTTRTTTFVTAEWARKWPAEEIWVGDASPPDALVLARPRRSAGRSSSSCASRSTSSRPTTSSTTRPTPTRSSSFAARRGQGALRPHRRRASRSASTRPCILDGRVYGKAGDARRRAARCSASSRAARTRSSPACACSAPATTCVEHASTRRDVPAARRTATIAAYLASGEWEGRAGALRDPGPRRRLVERIEGDYLNVVGSGRAARSSTVARACTRAESLAAEIGCKAESSTAPLHGLVQAR